VRYSEDFNIEDLERERAHRSAEKGEKEISEKGELQEHNREAGYLETAF
jgi:hypothetical protein